MLPSWVLPGVGLVLSFLWAIPDNVISNECNADARSHPLEAWPNGRRVGCEFEEMSCHWPTVATWVTGKLPGWIAFGVVFQVAHSGQAGASELDYFGCDCPRHRGQRI